MDDLKGEAVTGNKEDGYICPMCDDALVEVFPDAFVCKNESCRVSQSCACLTIVDTRIVGVC